MPAAMTHNYFANDVYRKLDPKLKRKIDKGSMLVFAEGPDVFYYYLLNPFKVHTVQNFANFVHNSHTKKFFYHYVDCILKFRLEKKKEIVGSLYGYITHFVLDSITHPFVYYKTGFYDKENPEMVTYTKNHAEMELLIDLFMLEKREKKNPKKIKIAKMLFPKTEYSIQLKNLLNRVYQDVYGVSDMGRKHLSSIRQMRFIYRHFYYDPHGIKLSCYRILAKVLPRKLKMIEYISYANNLRSKVSYINYEHDTWCHPLDQNETSTASFFDLYQEAVTKAVSLITYLDRVLDGKVELKQLEKKLKDISYSTGKDCKNKSPMRYFEH